MTWPFASGPPDGSTTTGVVASIRRSCGREPGSRSASNISTRLSSITASNRLPAARTWDEWAKRVPRPFQFAVKASRLITHFKRFKHATEPVGMLLDRAEHLGAHLGPVLYQARPDF